MFRQQQGLSKVFPPENWGGRLAPPSVLFIQLAGELKTGCQGGAAVWAPFRGPL